MGVVETVTISAVTYEVYGLGNANPVGDADEWFGGRLGVSAWTAATADQKAQALVTARRMMDRRPIWTGTKTDPAQGTELPRDGMTCDGEAVADGEPFPDNIVYGEFELALALLEDESIQDSSGTGSNVKSAAAGSAKVEFFRPTINGPNDLAFPVQVMEYIGCYFDSSNIGTGGVVTGTDVDSEFDDELYNLNEGYA